MLQPPFDGLLQLQRRSGQTGNGSQNRLTCTYILGVQLYQLFLFFSEADAEQLVKIVVEELRLRVHHLNGALMLGMLMLSLNGSISEIFKMVFFQLRDEAIRPNH